MKHKLKILSEIWQYYALEYKFMQGEIRFDANVKSNYFADIMDYFSNTLDLVVPQKSGSRSSAILNAIVLLQVMYVHQDLIDELLYIFKLNDSSKEDKDPIRSIRNELVGHPISRDPERKFISSAFIGNDHNDQAIHYVLYSRASNFYGVDKSYMVDELIEMHRKYLIKYLDMLLHRAGAILRKFEKKLNDLERLVCSEESAELIVKVADFYCEAIFRESYIFNQNFLPVYFNRRAEHIRYRYAWELFLHELAAYIRLKKKNIEDIILKKSTPYQPPPPFEPIAIVLGKPVVMEPDAIVQPSASKSYHYELSKLMARDHPIFNVQFFKKIFKDNSHVIEELHNMEKHFDSDLEYFASYEFVRYLLGENGDFSIQ